MTILGDGSAHKVHILMQHWNNKEAKYIGLKLLTEQKKDLWICNIKELQILGFISQIPSQIISWNILYISFMMRVFNTHYNKMNKAGEKRIVC